MRLAHMVHRGVVEAAGLVIDPSLVGEHTARRRVLKLWHPGTQVFRVPGNLLLVRLARHVLLRCTEASGAPLVRLGAVSCSAPLGEEHLKVLDPPAGSVVLVRAGRVEVIATHATIPIDPSTWLDLEPYRLCPARSLGAPPPPPELAEQPIEGNSRALLGPGSPEVSEEAREIATALTSEGAPEGGGVQEGAAAPSGAMVIGGLIQAARQVLRSLLRRLRPGPAGAESSAAPGSAGTRPAEVPARPGLMELLERMWTRLVLASKLGNLVGRRQARYLLELMGALDGGDLDAALRRAIPLAKLGEADSEPALGVPKARDDMQLSMQPPRPARSMLVTGVFDELRSRYLDAARRLERLGRIRDAVFVYTELLQDAERAVQLLERHGELRLAAEVAEAYQAAPEMVVRQWFIAGEFERAITIARRSGAFAGAVALLERSHRESARTLRLQWAASLARSGSYAAAVQAAWPVAEARHLALEWMERAIRAGGAAGARMLAYKASVAESEFEAVYRAARDLLAFPGPETDSAAMALSQTILRLPQSRPLQILARLAARWELARLGNAAVITSSGDLQRAKQLVSFSRDQALRADLPQLAQQVQRRPEPVAVLAVDLDPFDVGGQPIHDAAVLANGRILAAIGEAGVLLLSPAGSIVSHFDQPAQYLVVNPEGTRALALAPRDDVYRIARIDVDQRKAALWCEARCDLWATSYDGSLWFMVEGNTLVAVDAHADLLKALWRVADLDGVPVALAWDPHGVAMTCVDDEIEVWRFALPQLQLRERRPLSTAAVHGIGVSASGEAGRIVESSGGDVLLWMAGRHPAGLALQESATAAVQQVEMQAGRAAVRFETEDGTAVDLIEIGKHVRTARISLPLSTQVRLRLDERRLVVCDLRGRLVVIDAALGIMEKSLRV